VEWSQAADFQAGEARQSPPVRSTASRLHPARLVSWRCGRKLTSSFTPGERPRSREYQDPLRRSGCRPESSAGSGRISIWRGGRVTTAIDIPKSSREDHAGEHCWAGAWDSSERTQALTRALNPFLFYSCLPAFLRSRSLSGSSLSLAFRCLLAASCIRSWPEGPAAGPPCLSPMPAPGRC
jgi:hypothetical protein